MTTMRETIEQRLREALHPESLTVDDESALHAEHGVGGGHYRVRVVAEAFRGKGLVERHRAVYGLFREELKGAIHALALTTLAPGERG
jgi:BolA protein